MTPIQPVITEKDATLAHAALAKWPEYESRRIAAKVAAQNLAANIKAVEAERDELRAQIARVEAEQALAREVGSDSEDLAGKLETVASERDQLREKLAELEAHGAATHSKAKEAAPKK